MTPRVALKAGRGFTVTVKGFSATPEQPDPQALYGFTVTPDGTALISQPAAAHRLFPSNDHPSDKAGFTVTTDVPSGWIGVASGVQAVTRSGHGRGSRPSGSGSRWPPSCFRSRSATSSSGTARRSAKSGYAMSCRAARALDEPADGTLRVLGQCVAPWSASSGSRMHATACTGSARQQLTLKVARDLVHLSTDMCVDVADWNGGNGAPTQLWTCAGTDNQKWN